MIIPAREVQEALNAVWPDLQQIWCFDPDYICPTRAEVSQFIGAHGIDIAEIRAQNADCDDFALQQHAQVKASFNWAFGEAFADKVNGVSLLHSLNICCTRAGVYLIEPRKKTMWKADAMRDNVLWVRL